MYVCAQEPAAVLERTGLHLLLRKAGPRTPPYLLVTFLTHSSELLRHQNAAKLICRATSRAADADSARMVAITAPLGCAAAVTCWPSVAAQAGAAWRQGHARRCFNGRQQRTQPE